MQEQTTFSQLVDPPRDRGIDVVQFSSALRKRLPQYWQVLSSRA